MTVTLRIGDCRRLLRAMPADSVDCVVTSPPYWGLRDYGVPGQIGMERSMGEHLDVLVGVFSEVWRVLKPTGTVWLNYGDAYATTPASWPAARYAAAGTDDRTFRDKPFSTIGPIREDVEDAADVCGKHSYRGGGSARIGSGGILKTKDLLLLPARLAIALQDSGWYVRSEIVWHKPNPMPESVRDRPVIAHEKMFLLAKSGGTTCWHHVETGAWVYSAPDPDYRWRHRKTRDVVAAEPGDPEHWFRFNLWQGQDYFYDAAAVRTPMKDSSVARDEQPTFDQLTGGPKDSKEGNRSHRKTLENIKAARRDTSGWASSENYKDQDPRYGKRTDGRPALEQDGHGRRHAGFNERWEQIGKGRAVPPRNEGYTNHERLSEVERGTANLRNVWSIPTMPFKGAHFATFPTALVEPCIKAGCPAGGVVLDPFGGSGTVGVVGNQLQRDVLLFELNEDYAAIAVERMRADAGLLLDIRVERALEAAE